MSSLFMMVMVGCVMTIGLTAITPERALHYRELDALYGGCIVSFTAIVLVVFPWLLPPPYEDAKLGFFINQCVCLGCAIYCQPKKGKT